jgi:uncharacterized protein (DUF2147 family)
VITCGMTKEKMVRLIAMFVVMFSFTITGHIWTAVAADTAKSSRKSDTQLLVGRWVRPDGGYVLELKVVGKDGNLKAAYFNPRSIHVSRAEFHRNGGTISIFVELRDVNYPGSTYNLQYDPTSDRLKGIYFLAALQQQYEVEFERTK